MAAFAGKRPFVVNAEEEEQLRRLSTSFLPPPPSGSSPPTLAPSFGLSALCARHARCSARAPLALIAASVAASLALASGVLWAPGGLVVDSDPDKIWVPPGTAAARQEAFFDAVFDPFLCVSRFKSRKTSSQTYSILGLRRRGAAVRRLRGRGARLGRATSST